MYVPVGTTSSLGVVKQHTAADCTSYTSDEGATTPAAVKKAVGLFVSVTPSLTSGTKIGTITINGASTDLYCQTDTNTTYGADRGISLVSGKFGHSNTAITAGSVGTA